LGTGSASKGKRQNNDNEGTRKRSGWC